MNKGTKVFFGSMLKCEDQMRIEELVLKYHESFFKWNEVDTRYIRRGIKSVIFSKDTKTFVIIYYEKFTGYVYKEFVVEELSEWLDKYGGSWRSCTC